MADCVHCSKRFSGRCKQCPGYITELAAFERAINEHVHNMAMEACSMKCNCDSKSQETKPNVVSSHCKSPLIPMYEETQAGHLSYPKTIFNTVPACNLSPGERSDGVATLSSLWNDSESLGDSIYHDAISTEKADEFEETYKSGMSEELLNGLCGKPLYKISDEREPIDKPHCFRYVELYQHSTPLAQLAQSGTRICSSRAIVKVVGSNPTRGFPAQFHSLRWIYGAGKTFLSEIIPPPHPCADYNYAGAK